MFRTEPLNDEKRLDILNEEAQIIEDAFEKFKKEGLIGEVGTFPYSTFFGKQISSKIHSNKGWITYFNLLESENINNLPLNQWMIGLRPLAAGNVFLAFNKLDNQVFKQLVEVEDFSKEECILYHSLHYCLLQDCVKSNVLSINTIEQANKIKKVLSENESFNLERTEVIYRLLKDVES